VKIDPNYESTVLIVVPIHSKEKIKMKVAQIAPGYIEVPPLRGGAVEKHIIYLSEELKRLGLKVDIYARMGKNKQNKLKNTIYLSPPIKKSFLPIKIIDTFRYTFNLVKRLHHKKYDIIHLHGGIAGLIQSILIRKGRDKLVLTIHNPLIFSPNPIKRGLATLMELISASKADAIITVSKTMKELFKRKLKDKIVEYIPNGVHIRSNVEINQNYAKLALGLKGKKVILFVGRMALEKGIHILISALNQIIHQYRQHDVRLVLVGPPGKTFGGRPSKYYKFVMNLIRKYNLNNFVIYLGNVSEKTLRLTYVACDIFVLPSISDAMPMTLLEAMAHGKPVISTWVGGIPDFIEHSKTGILVPPNDPSTLANAIQNILTKKTLAETFSRNAVTEIEEKYSWKKVAIKIYKLYSTLTK